MATTRKMLVTAFAKVAERWEDSKTCPNGLRYYGFRNSRDWGRQMVRSYYAVGNEIICNFLAEEIEKAIINDEPITQAFFDDFVMEELSAW